MATDAKIIRKFECFRQLTDEQVEEIAEISNSYVIQPDMCLLKRVKKGRSCIC